MRFGLGGGNTFVTRISAVEGVEGATPLASTLADATEAASSSSATLTEAASNPVVDVLFFVAAALLIAATILVISLNVSYYKEKQQLQADDDAAYEQLGYGVRERQEGLESLFSGQAQRKGSDGQASVASLDEESDADRESGRIAATSKGFGRRRKGKN